MMDTRTMWVERHRREIGTALDASDVAGGEEDRDEE
jgi:hypothetical protein